MSGEAGGALGVLLVAPFMLPVVAAGALAAGTAAIAASAINEAEKEREIRKLRKQQNENLKRCSKRIALHQIALNEKLNKISEEHEKMFKNVSEIVQRSAELRTQMDSLRIMEERGTDVIFHCRQSLFETLEQTFTAEQERLEQNLNNTLSGLEQISNETLFTREKIEGLETKVSSERAEKAEVALEYISDAELLMENLFLKSEMYNRLRYEQISTLMAKLDAAKKDYEAGLYDKAIDETFGIILKTDSLSGTIEYEGNQKRLLEADLKFRYEYLISWINEARYIDRDADEEYGHDIHEDLNDFSQERVQNLLRLLEQRKSEISDSCVWSKRLFKDRVLEYEEKLVPYAEKLMIDAYVVMQNYLKKLDILEALEPFMQDQGFDIEWSTVEGGDYSQQVVANFKSMQTGGEISVLIDSESPMNADSTMWIEMLSFGESAEAGLEERRREMRQRLMERLSKNNIVTRQEISCNVNTQNQSSEREIYKNPNAVKAMRPSVIDMG